MKSAVLSRLDSLKNVYLSEFDNGKPENEIIWLGITSIIRPCSTAGTAQWQYVLPNKKKSRVLEPFKAFALKMEQMTEDIMYAGHHNWLSNSKIINTDARNPEYKEKELFDLVITSPPYPNNYDYADATRLEMTFWGEIQGWGNLHSSVRQYLLRSCSLQDSGGGDRDMDTVNQYRAYIQQLIKKYATQTHSYGDIETQVIEDTTHDHYQVYRVGWHNDRRVHGCILHLDIKDGKIWIQHNSTEKRIAAELVKLGIPKDDIVLGFHAPYRRQFTEYATR